MKGLLLDGGFAWLDGRKVLDGMEVWVEPGELVAIVGPNGAGKTSAIRALAGLLPVSKGTVELDGDEISTLNAAQRAERVAYLAQDRHVSWNMPAVEIVALGAPFLSAADAKDAALTALKELEADHLADRGVADMSGGERARVLIARVLASPAGSLLLDEPIAGLDPDAQLLVLDVLKSRARRGQAVLVSLHDLTLTARWADRVIVAGDGFNKTEGPPWSALRPEILKDVFGLNARWIDGPDGPLLSSVRHSPEVSGSGVRSGSSPTTAE